MKRSLIEEIRLMRAINKRYGDSGGTIDGIRVWLDQFEILAHGKKPCGCAKLGGGGRRYCSGDHLLDSLNF